MDIPFSKSKDKAKRGDKTVGLKEKKLFTSFQSTCP
jgi:hypothetical protein